MAVYVERLLLFLNASVMLRIARRKSSTCARVLLLPKLMRTAHRASRGSTCMADSTWLCPGLTLEQAAPAGLVGLSALTDALSTLGYKGPLEDGLKAARAVFGQTVSIACAK